jgi:hypothetical protein
MSQKEALMKETSEENYEDELLEEGERERADITNVNRFPFYSMKAYETVEV